MQRAHAHVQPPLSLNSICTYLLAYAWSSRQKYQRKFGGGKVWQII